MIKRSLLVFFLLLNALCACDMKGRTHVPSHVAEFYVATSDYRKMMAKFDKIAFSLGLKRIGASPGLNELKEREVLYAAYELRDGTERLVVLTVTDVMEAGRILVRVYADALVDFDQRARFVEEVAEVVGHFGGTVSEAGVDTQP